jgi:hypothetical protein
MEKLFANLSPVYSEGHRTDRAAMIPTIETNRLVLRAFRQTDIDEYAAMCADTEVMRYLSGGTPMNREDAWRHMAMILGHWQLRGYGLWAVTDMPTKGYVFSNDPKAILLPPWFGAASFRYDNDEYCRSPLRLFIASWRRSGQQPAILLNPASAGLLCGASTIESAKESRPWR